MAAACIIFCPVFQTQASPSSVCENPWFLEDIRACDGWNVLSSSQADFSEPVTVAVIDTGCDYSHPLIANALWVNTAELNGSEDADDDGNGYIDDIYGIDTCNQDNDPMDDSVGAIKGHGTHVAGTILQTAGVTCTENPFRIRLMLLKAGDAYGNFDAGDVAEAVRYAADNGASVINMSISSVKAPSVLEEALDYASDTAILVASAGNKGLPTRDSSYTSCADYYPAGYPFVAGVMSYGTDHTLSGFSNWDFRPYSGAEYEIAAPGEAICSCTYQAAYKTMNGTSMASGIVAGCAALLQAKYHHTGLYTARDLTAHLMESAPQAITYTDIYGQSHTFRGIRLQHLLLQEPEPKLVLADISLQANESSPRSFTLSYTLLNRGCAAREISVDISTDAQGSVQSESFPELPHELKALSQYKGNCNITVPEEIPEGGQVTFHLNITYDHAAAPLKASLTADIGSVSPDFPPDIPLLGISLSPASQLLLQPRDARFLNVSYIPENTTDDRTLTFLSSAPLVASVDENGLVTAHHTGSAVISVLSAKGHLRKMTVTVYARQKPSSPDPDISGSDMPDTNPPAADVPTHPTTDIPIAKGMAYTVKGMKYRITGTGKGAAATAALIGTTRRKSSLKSLSVNDTVTIGKKSFRVTAVGKDAFRGFIKLKTLQLGKYVKTIGKSSFRGCRNLKRLTIRSRQLKSIGKAALKGISKRALIRIPEGKRSRYRRLLTPRTGFRASMKLKLFFNN